MSRAGSRRKREHVADRGHRFGLELLCEHVRHNTGLFEGHRLAGGGLIPTATEQVAKVELHRHRRRRSTAPRGPQLCDRVISISGRTTGRCLFHAVWARSMLIGKTSTDGPARTHSHTPSVADLHRGQLLARRGHDRARTPANRGRWWTECHGLDCHGHDCSRQHLDPPHPTCDWHGLLLSSRAFGWPPPLLSLPWRGLVCVCVSVCLSLSVCLSVSAWMDGWMDYAAMYYAFPVLHLRCSCFAAVVDLRHAAYRSSPAHVPMLALEPACML